jgi:hypothetical protein
MSSSGGSDSAGDARDAAMGMGGKTRNTSPTSFSGGDDNREQRITNQYTSPEGIAVASRDPSFGDPDPQVDVSPQERDSITSFLDNYSANLRANPLMGGTIGALTALYQTGQARNMLMDTPGYELSMTGATPQQSMVNDYFANLNMGQQPLSSSLQTSYNNAKNNVDSILGTNQQFGYSTTPYGLLSSTNLADNPFNIEYLTTRGLI